MYTTKLPRNQECIILVWFLGETLRQRNKVSKVLTAQFSSLLNGASRCILPSGNARMHVRAGSYSINHAPAKPSQMTRSSQFNSRLHWHGPVPPQTTPVFTWPRLRIAVGVSPGAVGGCSCRGWPRWYRRAEGAAAGSPRGSLPLTSATNRALGTDQKKGAGRGRGERERDGGGRGRANEHMLAP